MNPENHSVNTSMLPCPHCDSIVWTHLILPFLSLCSHWFLYLIGNLNSDENLQGYELFSSAIADVLSEPSLRTPITVGLFARWGSGKSFLLGRLRSGCQCLLSIMASLFCLEDSTITLKQIHTNQFIQKKLSQNIFGSGSRSRGSDQDPKGSGQRFKWVRSRIKGTRSIYKGARSRTKGTRSRSKGARSRSTETRSRSKGVRQAVWWLTGAVFRIEAAARDVGEKRGGIGVEFCERARTLATFLKVSMICSTSLHVGSLRLSLL